MLLGKKDVILALPYVALVAEKVRELKKLATRLQSFTVVEYAGTKGRFPLPKQNSYLRTLYVGTNEKANAIWRYLCKDNGRREEIGLVTLDEVHMISDGVRGTIIEEFIVSLIHWSRGEMRILALSATIGNPKTVQVFLGGGDAGMCNLFQVGRRPIKLKENMVVAGLAVPLYRDEETGKGTVTYSEGDDVGTLLECDTGIPDGGGIFNNFDDGMMFNLVMQTVKRGGSVLVFCSTRNMCTSLCKTMTAAINYCRRNMDGTGDDEAADGKLVQTQRDYVRGHLLEESKGHVDQVLLDGISVGVAYHSAALHATERKAVEDGFAKGILSVLFCTTTLAAGVNLPADRVIIRSPWTGRLFLKCSQYKQMVGRAGRTNVREKQRSNSSSADGQEFEPDSYVFIQAKDVERFQMLVDQDVEDVYSQLLFQPSYYSRKDNRPTQEPSKSEEFTGVTRIIFNALDVSGTSIPLEDIIAIFKLTLLYQAGDKSTPEAERTVKPLLEELKSLHMKDFIAITDCNRDETEKTPPQIDVEAYESGRCKFEQWTVQTTALAAAATAGSINIDQAEIFVREAENFQHQMNLDNTLMFLYLSLTEDMCRSIEDDLPTNLTVQGPSITLLINRELAQRFTDHQDAEALRRIGVSEISLNSWVRGRRPDQSFNMMLKRLWSALFVKEVCLTPDHFEDHCRKFGFDRGMALELSSGLASRCLNLKMFCQVLGKFWWYPPLALTVSGQLGDACEEKLRPLLVIRHVTIERAKAMVKMGLRTAHESMSSVM